MKITMNGVTFEGVTMIEAKQIIAAAAVASSLGAASAPRTLAVAKASSWTERIHRGTTRVAGAINMGVGVVGDWSANKLSTLEVKTVPAIVSTTGNLCAKSAFTAVSIGTTLSSFADRCAAARARMEFAE